jgi:hypothetical protein
MSSDHADAVNVLRLRVFLRCSHPVGCCRRAAVLALVAMSTLGGEFA